MPSTISVLGNGQATLSPDLAMVSFVVSATGEDLATLRDDVNRRASSVLARLRQMDVQEADIQAPDLTIQPEYDYTQGQRLIGHRVARAMSVRLQNIAALGELLDGIAGAGANEIHGAQLSAADKSAAERQALRAAYGAARAKAQELADAAGVELGALVRLEEEPSFDDPMPMLRSVAESADMTTESVPGQVTVTRRIRGWFSIA